MPPVRLLKRQRRRRVNNASAASAIQANASTESLPLTLPYPHRTVLATPSVSTSADRSFSADDRDHVASVGGRRRLVSTAFPSVPPAALDKVESFTYARAVSAAAHSTGGMNGVPGIPEAPNQWLTISNLTPLAYSHSDAPHDIPLSFQYAQSLAERPIGNPPHQYDHPPPGVSQAEVAPNSDDAAQLLEDLRILATWPRLRVATLPDPVVGGHDFDPTGVADRLGMKGLSVYSAFVERESYRCHVCGVQSKGMSLALLHQRNRRHFQQQ